MCFYAVAVDRSQLKSKWHYILLLVIGAFVYDLLWVAFCGTVILMRMRVGLLWGGEDRRGQRKLV